MHGEVVKWKMTEEERLAYIDKYPIRSEKKPKGASFSNIHEYGERKKRKNVRKATIMDTVDKDELHKRFVAGEKLEDIAISLNISMATLNSFIREQRKVEADKWPYRVKKR